MCVQSATILAPVETPFFPMGLIGCLITNGTLQCKGSKMKQYCSVNLKDNNPQMDMGSAGCYSYKRISLHWPCKQVRLRLKQIRKSSSIKIVVFRLFALFCFKNKNKTDMLCQRTFEQMHNKKLILSTRQYSK